MRDSMARILDVQYPVDMELTADDLLPLVAKLNRAEYLRLLRLALARVTHLSDAERYELMPVGPDEFGSDADDPRARGAEEWDGVP